MNLDAENKHVKSKWLDPKYFDPPIDIPFIAYVKNTYDVNGISHTVIPVIKNNNDEICNLFSLYICRYSLKIYKYTDIIAWKALPRKPFIKNKNMEKFDDTLCK